MRRCILLFFCVLAACSPKHYSGELTAQSYQQSAMADSSSVSRSLRETVTQSVAEESETDVTTETETVVEVFSAPDTAGVQYVIQRETTRQKTQSKTSTGRTKEMESDKLETSDSLQVSAAAMECTSQMSDVVDIKTKRPLPWWSYLAAAAAAALALFYVIRRNRI